MNENKETIESQTLYAQREIFKKLAAMHQDQNDHQKRLEKALEQLSQNITDIETFFVTLLDTESFQKYIKQELEKKVNNDTNAK